MSQQQRVILVSGANKGIGFGVVQLLASKFPQDIVLLGTRDLKNGEQAIKQASNDSNNFSNVKLIQLDVTDAESVKAAVSKVESEYGHLNVLISNSGVATYDQSKELTQSVLDVNVTGVQRMNDAFLPLLLKSTSQSSEKPLIIVVGSEVGAWFNYSIKDEKLKQLILSPEKWNNDTAVTLVTDFIASFDASPSSTYDWDIEVPFKVYGGSKAIVGGYSRWYAREHPEVNIVVETPGYCATELNNFQGFRSIAQGAESVIWHMSNKLESGHFYRDGEELAWESASEM